MRVRNHGFILAAIFLAVFLSRLAISFSSEAFDYDAYFNIRQAENIRQNGFLYPGDGLLFSPHPFMPFFHYLLAFASLVFPFGLVLKVLPNILASTVVFFSYLVSYELTKDRFAALFSALSAGFVPVFFVSSVTSVSEYSLVLPLMLFLVYLFLRVQDGRSVLFFVLALFVLVLSHVSSLIFVFGLSIYVTMVYSLGAKVSKAELEITLFSLVASLWLVSIFFKESILDFSVLQPEPVSVDFIGSIYLIGIMTFIAGLFISYKYVFESRRKDVHVLISLSLTVVLLVFLRLLSFDVGLMFFGVFFAAMSGEAYMVLFDYLKKTHIASLSFLILFLVFVGFFLTSVIPSLSAAVDKPSGYEIAGFEWLRGEKTDDVVFADLREGGIVAAVSGKRNFLDDGLALGDASQRLSDLKELFLTRSQVSAVEILDMYGIGYIVVTRSALERMNITGLGYLSDRCFDQVYENRDVKIYKSLCRVV